MADLLADIAKRVTRQADRFFAKRADADGKVGPADPVMANLLQYSLFGPQELERVEPPPVAGKSSKPKMKSRNCVDLDGFNLHADVRIHEVARERLEHLVRYVCRPVIAAKRLEAVGEHKVRITFKNEWKGGVSGVTLTKRDLALRIIAQIPLPRRASLRYHGIFGPAAKDREQVVPARGGRVAHNKRKGKAKCRTGAAVAEGADTIAAPGAAAAMPAQPAIKLIGEAEAKYGNVANDDGATDSEVYSTKMTWAQALKRAFFLDILACSCGGRRRVIAAILDSKETERILKHVNLWRPPGAAVDAETIAIRGPPGSFEPENDDLDDTWDGWDEADSVEQAA